MKDIDAEYYGYRDEDDGALVPLEQEYEKQGIVDIPAENTQLPMSGERRAVKGHNESSQEGLNVVCAKGEDCLVLQSQT